MTSTTPEAKIYYTDDGSEPSVEKTLYSDAISITGVGDGESKTIKAIATKEGMTDSDVMEITYTNNHITA